MRVTMLGISGSGKTSYMSGLAQRLGQDSVAGYTIAPDADNPMDAALARANLQKLQFAQNDYSFPIGTTSTTTWTFNLLKNGKKVCYFEWVDFRGGYLDQLHDGIKKDAETEVQEFIAYVEASDAVLICVDSIRMHLHRGPTAFQHFTKAPGIFRFLIDTSSKRRAKTFVIVGTKADSDVIPAELRLSNFAGLSEMLAQATESLYRPLLENGWSGAITCVGAVGVGNVLSTVTPAPTFKDVESVSTRITNLPEPVNVELPVLFCLREQLRKTVTLGKQVITRQEYDLQRLLEEKNLMKTMSAKFRGIRTPQEEAEDLRRCISDERMVLQTFAPAVPELDEILRRRLRTL